MYSVQWTNTVQLAIKTEAFIIMHSSLELGLHDITPPPQQQALQPLPPQTYSPEHYTTE